MDTGSQSDKLPLNSEIITKLVTEKFKHMLESYKYKSFIRRNFRRKRPSRYLKCDAVCNKIEKKSGDDEMNVKRDVSTKKDCGFCKRIHNKSKEKSCSVSEDRNQKYTTNVQEILQDNTPETVDSSMNTSQASSLVSYPKMSTLVSSMLSNHLSRTISSQALEFTSLHANESIVTLSTDVFQADTLIREADVQYQIIFETSKALNFCLNSNTFRFSKERIEAERILLLASRKRQILLNELNGIECSDVSIRKPSGYVGHLEISNLTFPTIEETNREDAYIAILSCGTTVLATEITSPNKETEINFKKKFQFDNLDADFEIGVAIYALSVKDNFISTKSSLKKNTTMCMNIKSLSAKPNTAKPKYECSEDSSFKICGTTTIRVSDLTKQVPLKLWTPSHYASVLKGAVLLDFTSTIRFTRRYHGFLTIGTESKGNLVWNHCWCYLDGYKLNYWNHPSQECFERPVESIDLSYCINASITQAERKLCSKARTLCLETGKLKKSSDEDPSMLVCVPPYLITRYFLSAHSKEEMILWQDLLNSVIIGLRNWNCIKHSYYFN